VAGLEQGDASQLAHPTALAPKLVGTIEADDEDLSEHNDVLRTTAGVAGGPVLVCAWDKVKCGTSGKKTDLRVPSQEPCHLRRGCACTHGSQR
jgi:hypothetical protein